MIGSHCTSKSVQDISFIISVDTHKPSRPHAHPKSPNCLCLRTWRLLDCPRKSSFPFSSRKRHKHAQSFLSPVIVVPLVNRRRSYLIAVIPGYHHVIFQKDWASTRSLILPLLEPLIPLLLPLPLPLSNHIRRTILNEIALSAETVPFGQTVGDVHDALAVEHVAPISNRQPQSPIPFHNSFVKHPHARRCFLKV